MLDREAGKDISIHMKHRESFLTDDGVLVCVMVMANYEDATQLTVKTEVLC